MPRNLLGRSSVARLFRFVARLVLLILATLPLQAAEAATVSWNNPAGGNWNTDANWSPAQVPSGGDDVIITLDGTYTVTLDVGASIKSLTLGGVNGTQTLSMPANAFSIDGQSVVNPNGLVSISGATFTGPGNLEIHGGLEWTGGAMSGTGTTSIAAGGIFTLSGAAAKSLQRGVSNAGTTTWSQGQVNTGDGSVFTNQASGTFAIQSDDYWYYDLGGASAQVTNQAGGTVTKSTTSGTTTFLNVPFNNDGTVAASSGTLSLSGGGTSAGTFTMTSGAHVDFADGTHILNAGTLVSGAGTARLTTGTLTVAGAVTALNLEVNGGTLDGVGTLTVGGILQWTGGAMGGSGLTQIATGAALNIGGPAAKNLQRALSNAGTTTWSQGQVNTGDGAVFTNQAGGIFAIQSDDYWYYDLGGDPAQVTNQAGGTVTKSTTSGTTTFLNVPFNNDGTVAVSSGILSLSGGGTSAGTFMMTGAGHVDFAAGTQILNAGAVLNGASTARVTGGTLTVAGAVTALNLEVNAGALDGGGTLTVDGTLQWTGGAMSGSGLTQIATGAALSIGGPAAKDLRRALGNAGTTTWSQGQVNTGDGAVFTNQAGGTFAIQSDEYWYYDLGGDPAQVTNQAGGTVTKSTTSGTTTFLNVPFNNDGTVAASGGILSLSGGGTSAGTFTMTGVGNVDFAASTQILNAGAVVNGTSTARVTGGTLTVAGAVTALNMEVNVGTLDGGGTLTVNGILLWNGGAMGGSGLTQIATGAVLSIGGPAAKNLQRALSNAGTTTWSQGTVNTGNGALFTNQAGGIFAIQSDEYWYYDLGGDPAQVTNQAGGTVTKSTTTGTTTFLNVPFKNDGTVNANSGTLSFANGYTQTGGALHLAGGDLSTSATIAIAGGILDGTGTITGNVQNSGQVNPGSSPGVITVIGGGYVQGSAGVLNIEISGLTAGTGFDQLNLATTPTLAGTLNVLVNGFSPTPGDSFIIVNNQDAAAVTGTFTGLLEGATVTSGGTHFQITYVGGTGNDVVLIAAGAATVTPTAVATATATITAAATASPSPSGSPTMTRTPTATGAPTGTVIQAGTATATPTSTYTSTATSTTPPLTLGPSATPTATPMSMPHGGCVADCNSDGSVTIGELVRGIRIGLDTLDVGQCRPLDTDFSTTVETDELLDGVNDLLAGCAALPALPTATPVGNPPTPTPTVHGDGSRPLVLGATVVTDAMSLVPTMVAAIVEGIEFGSSGSSSLSIQPLAAGMCPQGGTAKRTGNFPLLSIDLKFCRAATASGFVTFDGTASLQFTTFSVDLQANFTDAAGTPTLLATAGFGGAISPSLGGNCFLTAATLTGTSGTLSGKLLPSGPEVGLTFQNTTLAIANINFTAGCVPQMYRMTLNGPAELRSSAGSPFDVEFKNLLMDVTDRAVDTLFDLHGGLTSACFGGAVTVATGPSLSVRSDEICPTAGAITATFPGGTAHVTYRADQSIEIDTNGDGIADDSAPNCLDPGLLMCLG